jgi:hypothetical protein
MSTVLHKEVGPASNHGLTAVTATPFADNAARDAHTYVVADVGKVVQVVSPLAWYLVRSVTLGVATFGEVGSASGGGAVDSVFGRAGVVTATAGDYAASLVSNDSGVAGATVKAALDQLESDMAALVPTSRTLTASTGLTGGGDLSANRSFAVSFGASSSTACVGNDARLSDSRTPTTHATSHLPGGSDALTTAAPSQGIGGSNAVGTAASFARSDHDHTIRETGGPTNLTIGAIADGQDVRRSGTTLIGVTPGAAVSITGWLPTLADVIAFSGIKFYGDANTVTLTSGKVSSWTDQSGQGNHATQSNSSKQPTISSAVINGLDTIAFASVHCLQIASLALSSFSIVSVLRNVPNAAQLVYEHSADINSNNGCFLISENTGSTFGAKRSGNRTDKNITTWDAGLEPFIVAHHYNGTHVQHYGYLRGNSGTVLTNGASTSATPGTSTVTDTFNIGSRNNAASLGLSGEIAAMVIFSPALDPGHLAAVTRHLANKYQLYYG